MTAPEMQQEIEHTREHLGQTVEELAARADVKARARATAAGMKDKAAGMKARAQGKATEVSGQLRQSQLRQGQHGPPLAARRGRRGRFARRLRPGPAAAEAVTPLPLGADGAGRTLTAGSAPSASQWALSPTLER